MKKTTLLLSVILSLITHFALAQSLYTQQSQGGITGSVGYHNQNNISAKNINLGISIAGIIDLGIGYTDAKMNEFTGYQNIQETGISPYVNLILIKQDNRYRTFSVFTGVRTDLFQMLSSNDYHTPLKANQTNYSAHLGITRMLDLGYSSRIAPTASITYNKSTVSYNSINENGKQLLLKESITQLNNIQSNEYGMTLALPLIVGGNIASNLLIEPSFSYTNISKRYGLKLGFLLATNSKSKCKGGICPVF